MTAEIEYSLPRPRVASNWQVAMSERIEKNHGVPIKNIERELHGSRFVVRVDANLPNSAVENMLSDIEEYLPDTANHTETRQV